MLVVDDWHARDGAAVDRRLTVCGLVQVRDWGGFPCQVTGRVPPDLHWFHFRERCGSALIEIYPPARYPFAAPGSSATAGWSPMALGEEPPILWAHPIDTPDGDHDVVALAERLVVELLDLWRSSQHG